jgi:hypothetical protein
MGLGTGWNQYCITRDHFGRYRKPVDPNHYDGIIPPRITGDQLSRKSYSISKRGTVVFVTVPATNLSGQVINVRTTGLYYFDGTAWQPVSKDVDPIEYYILLTFDSNSTASLAATSTGRNQEINGRIQTIT